MKPSDASCRTFAKIVDFLDHRGWKVGRNDERLALHMVFGDENGSFACFLQVRPERPLILFYGIVGLHVPEKKRAAMAEYVTRANYGLCLGNFELDFADGEVRYKTSLDLQDGQLTDEMIESLVMVNVVTLSRYVPGIMSVVWADASPEAAVVKVEGNRKSPDVPATQLGTRSTRFPPFHWN